MKVIIGIILCFIGVFVGFCVGLWLMFIGGIIGLIQEIRAPDEVLLAKGGETQIEITTPKKEFIFATACCKPNFIKFAELTDGKVLYLPQNGDAFNRKLGLTIALGRALKEIEREEKEQEIVNKNLEFIESLGK